MKIWDLIIGISLFCLAVIGIYSMVWVLWNFVIIPAVLEPFFCEAFNPSVLKEGYCDTN